MEVLGDRLTYRRSIVASKARTRLGAANDRLQQFDDYERSRWLNEAPPTSNPVTDGSKAILLAAAPPPVRRCTTISDPYVTRARLIRI
ncbi:hypothetical protein EVAR_84323_1 [Eumeta japonica]|uniref:Uncharacterized protein n=1 Tax=Eumeta variegata TaxID=151549 RepID=A0A4C1U4M8_EUMVA|nr:hypothetical protein EVAR_84323_1 [Eumeta japonica]